MAASFFPKNSRTNYVYSTLLFAAQFAFGFYSNIILASLVDLRFVYSASLNQISYITIPAGLGYLVGSWANYLYRWTSRQAVLLVLLLINSVVIGLLPHYGSLAMAFGAIFVNGIGGGAFESAIGVWLIEMWPAYPLTILQSVGFMYGIGGVLAPLLAAPYVHGEKTNFTDEATAGQPVVRNITVEDRVHNLTVPFAVGCTAQAAVQLLFLVLLFTVPYRRPADRVGGGGVSSSSSTTDDEKRSQKLKVTHRTAKVALCGLCMAFSSSAEIGYMSFSTAMFQYLEIDLSAGQAAYVLSILSTAATVGRLLTAIISIRLKPDLVVSVHFALIIAGLSVVFFGSRGEGSLPVVYGGSAILGYGFAAIAPGMNAFTERHLKLTDRVASFYTFIGAGISLITPLILGQLFHAFPGVLFIIAFVFYGIAIGCFVFLRLWIAATSSGNQQGGLKNAVMVEVVEKRSRELGGDGGGDLYSSSKY